MKHVHAFTDDALGEHDAVGVAQAIASGEISAAEAVEAAIRFGWDRWLFGERGKREKSGFVGMHGFGASAPLKDLLVKFGFTVDAVIAAARQQFEKSKERQS